MVRLSMCMDVCVNVCMHICVHACMCMLTSCVMMMCGMHHVCGWYVCVPMCIISVCRWCVCLYNIMHVPLCMYVCVGW